MYEVNYNGWTSFVSNNCYCRIRSEALLYDAERDLLAIAKFLVRSSARPAIWILHQFVPKSIDVT